VLPLALAAVLTIALVRASLRAAAASNLKLRIAVGV
jgi:hypothetical protein